MDRLLLVGVKGQPAGLDEQTRRPEIKQDTPNLEK